MEPSDPSWGTAFPTVLFSLWQHTGKLDAVRAYLDKVVAYVDGLAAAAKASGFTKMMAKYADWFPPPNIASSRASKPFVSTAALVRDVQMTLQMLKVAGDAATVARYTALELWVLSEFNTAWYNATHSTYANSHQTELSQAVWLGAPPTPAAGEAVAATLVERIKGADGGHLSTGIVGTRTLFDALSMSNHTELALTLIRQPTYPSYGWMVGNEYEPATTLWEQWDAAMHAVEDYEDASRNHVMFGSVSSWFWRVLAGITPSSPGFATVRVAPLQGASCAFIAKLRDGAASAATPTTPPPPPRFESDGQLQWLSAQMRTVRGFVNVSWRFVHDEKTAMHVNVTMPVTARGVVALPCAAKNNVSILQRGGDGEDVAVVQIWPPLGLQSTDVDGVGTVAMLEDGSTVEVEVSSGTYNFIIHFEDEPELESLMAGVRPGVARRPQL